MRMRRLHHFRRMMCLLILCIWSFATMFYLWRQIKEKDDIIQFRKKAVASETIKTVLFARNNKIDKKKQIFSTNSTQTYIQHILQELKRSLNHQPTVKMRPQIQRKIDYGDDRDIDVEGVHDYMLWFENFQNINTKLPSLARHEKCTKPVENVALLKTHFTGSDVLTNILNRFGDLNNLNVALPNDDQTTFFWPMRFQWKYIDITLLNGSLPNIISNHARYNNDVMDNILNPGSVYITILREPVSQLETTFNNLGFGGLLQVTNTTDQLKKFLQFPKYYIQGVVRRKRFKDTLNLIKNGQFFDLGLATTDYHRRSIIKSTVKDLYEKFAVVLIYEYLDESLVLMKRKLCWQLDDILYLKFHQTAPNVWNREVIPEDLTNMIHRWNAADLELYEFFNKTLWEEIKSEGDGFWSEVKEFKRKRLKMEDECIVAQNFIDKSDKFTLLDIPSEQPPTVTFPSKEKNKKINKQTNLLHLNVLESNISLNTSKQNQQVNKQLSRNTTDFLMNLTRKKSTLQDVLIYTNLIHSKKEISQLNDDVQGSSGINSTSHVSVSDVDTTRKTDIGDDLEEKTDEINTEGSGGIPIIRHHLTTTASKTEKIISRTVSSWNSHFCKKLVMNEQEYLDYFRIKHAYAKAEMRKK